MKNNTPQEKYDSKNTIRFSLKLNIQTDKDIIEKIDKNNKQTSIKKLLRLGIKNIDKE